MYVCMLLEICGALLVHFLLLQRQVVRENNKRLSKKRKRVGFFQMLQQSSKVATQIFERIMYVMQHHGMCRQETSFQLIQAIH